MSAKRNLSGQIFNKLTVLEEEIGTFKKRRITWKCQCICGKIAYMETAVLTTGHSKSCGCGELENKRNNCKSGRILRTQVRKNPRLQLAKWVFQKNYSDGDLIFDEFLNLSQQSCFYCNTLPSNDLKFSSKAYTQEYRDASQFIYNGLDRINNDLPHDRNNIVTCCKNCNFAKRDRKYDEFINWIKYTYLNLENKKLL